MKNMTVIPPKPQKGNSAAKEEVKRLRVAAYCRVSTDNEEQASSYEAQIQHYEEFIKTNPEWEFVGVYADEGISATSTKNREQFNAMIEDCKAGKIDMIFYKVNQPFCPQHAGLPEIHPPAERDQHSGFL